MMQITQHQEPQQMRLQEVQNMSRNYQKLQKQNSFAIQSKQQFNNQKKAMINKKNINLKKVSEKLTLQNLIEIKNVKCIDEKSRINNQIKTIKNILQVFKVYTSMSQKIEQKSQMIKLFNNKVRSFIFQKKNKLKSHQNHYFLTITYLYMKRANIVIRSQNSIFAYYSFISNNQILSKIHHIISKIPTSSKLVIIQQQNQIFFSKYNLLEQLSYIKTQLQYYYIQLKSKKVSNNQDYSTINVKQRQYHYKIIYLGQKNKQQVSQLIQLYERIVNNQQQKLLQIRGNKKYNQRIIPFDCMIIYFQSIENCSLDLIVPKIQQLMQAKQQLVEAKLEYKETDFKHFPVNMKSCKICKVCKSEGYSNKSTFKCEGCSLLYSIDVTLCIDKTQNNCFRKFHENERKYAQDMRTNKRLLPLKNNQLINQIKKQSLVQNIELQNLNSLRNLDQAFQDINACMNKFIQNKDISQCNFILNALSSKLVTLPIYPLQFK